MQYHEAVKNQIETSIALKRCLQEQTSLLVTMSEVMVEAFRKRKKVYIFGNGGSAADAQHIAGELAGKFYHSNRAPLPAIALTTNTSSLTAIANDFGYDMVFVHQVQGLVQDGDVVVGISTSGNSNNVFLAVERAKELGAITIAFTGESGKLASIADYVLALPSNDTPRLQEAHITAGHIICFLIEEAILSQEI